MLTPIIGKLGDAHGKKKLLVVSLGIFGFASLGAALAPNIGVLIAFRALQGAGAAIFPLSFGIIRDEFPPQKVGVAIGTVSLGVRDRRRRRPGAQRIDRRAPELALPVPDRRDPRADLDRADREVRPESPIKTPAKPDYKGAAALSVGFASLLLALSEGTEWGWTSPGVLALVDAQHRRARRLGRDRAPCR